MHQLFSWEDLRSQPRTLLSASPSYPVVRCSIVNDEQTILVVVFLYMSQYVPVDFGLRIMLGLNHNSFTTETIAILDNLAKSLDLETLS
jgi:hypothetical protein